MEVLDITEVELKAPALMAMAAGGIWRVVLKTEELAAIAARIDAINAAPSVVVQRRAKRKDRRGREEVYFQDVDIRPMIQELVLEAGTAPCLRATLVSVNNKPGKIGEIVRLLTERPDAARVVKVDTLRIDPDGPASISHGWAPPPAREGRPGSAFVTYEEAPA
jgi:hypothetical protein